MAQPVRACQISRTTRYIYIASVPGSLEFRWLRGLKFAVEVLSTAPGMSRTSRRVEA